MKKISIMMLSVFMFMQVVPIIEFNFSASELNNQTEQEVEIEGGNLVLDGEEVTPEEFDLLLEDAELLELDYQEPSKQARSGAALAAWAGSSMSIAGLGTITIGTGGTIILIGVGVIATAWVVKKVNAYFTSKRDKAADSVSTSIKSSRYYVNLKLCKDSYGNTASKKKTGNFNCGKKWSLKKDTAKHGGSNWKVYYNGVRKASIDKNGKILRS